MKRILSLAVALVLWQGAACLAAEDAVGGELSDAEIVERVLDLRRELDALLAALPVELRDEVERRLAADPEAAAVEQPVAVAPAAEGAVAGTPAAVSTPVTRVADCAELAPFDTDGDGSISGFDRYWRFFRLWRDDGDGAVEPPELTTLYEAGVRELASDLARYETADGLDGGVRRVDGWITLELAGRKGGAATLMIDADRLGGAGELALVDAAGEPLGGLRRLGDETLLSVAGSPTRLACP